MESYVSSNNVAFTASLVGATLAALTTLDTAAASQLLPEKSQSDTVVLLGSGGREHALSVALAKSPLVGKIICLPGNGGTSAQGGKIVNATQEDGVTPLTKSDNATVVELVKRVGADMVVVGPEQPLVDGVVNELAKECPGVNCFGPSMAGAELEASKVRYSRNFLFGGDRMDCSLIAQCWGRFFVLCDYISYKNFAVNIPSTNNSIRRSNKQNKNRHSPKTFSRNMISPQPSIVTLPLPMKPLPTSNHSTLMIVR